MPSSYQPAMPNRDAREETHSQSLETNLPPKNAKVQNLLAGKGDRLVTISPDQTLGEAVEILRDERIGALVVTDAGGNLAGILSERDIVRKLADTPGHTLPQRVEQVMTAKVETCAPDELLDGVLRRMTEGRFRHMPIMHEQKLQGIVTIGDVVNFKLNQLEHEALQLKQLIVG